jgi:hypothetical protein
MIDIKCLSLKCDLQIIFVCSQVASRSTGNGGKSHYILCFIICCSGKGHHEPRSRGPQCQLCIAGTDMLAPQSL